MIEKHHPEAVKDLLTEGKKPMWVAYVLRDRTDATWAEIGSMIDRKAKDAQLLVNNARSALKAGMEKSIREHLSVDTGFISAIVHHTVKK